MATLIDSMKNILSSKDSGLQNETKRVILKELLQSYALDYIYNHSVYRNLNFYGGTCLHVVYGLNRLSEDVDLDNTAGVDLSEFGKYIHDYFRVSVGYSEVTLSEQQGEWGIRRFLLKFPVLFELGLSQHQSDVLHLKVEVSQHKQTSIIQKTPIFLYGRSFVTNHFSLETMMAGKMIACLERNFQKGQGASIKGRDFYDLLWFMQQGIQPLEEKLAMDGKVSYSTNSAMTLLGGRIEQMRIADLAEDLTPLFESRIFIQAWLDSFKENFFRFQQKYLVDK